MAVSVDFFIVPTISLRILFVFVVLEHRRRQVSWAKGLRSRGDGRLIEVATVLLPPI